MTRAKKRLLAVAAAAAVGSAIAPGLVVPPVVHAQVAVAREHRMIAMLFDFASMTPDQQARARQSAIAYVNGSLKAGDVVAVMSAETRGKVTIAQDFTGDAALLAAAIQRLPAGGSGLPAIESAAKLLGALPERKSLMYYSASSGNPGDPLLAQTIQALKDARTAIFPIAPQGSSAR